ncbi:hypothetical protein COW36_06880 [bacterium (Candidatus Blackallbacteria) CG17_big_fil_post_rev_8_21_14_2_50_48_46]|uniref:Peptidase M28 domain-containing protein n=1 Tax=bacterium (Candidatus Blackallbacteria) CG17_big_fil_post_rev_8_21_14_2_50_48_46 TaxID=2014261 RepID=A0A2M7G774_9BACT|nr:MAG: hypothetical protein COW64_05400 [bacterium (Candidatus Blackallbacteria) CG18_big_fil_WC_8_21_14_2_50_49_26]PIW17920.1 MAG: hypothetical protein COW36_06880 [bacterium (Candidatus Blackallbacteria) CG17_big_fil_post_rev_8_21_14_2_50_48_46]PIW45739.1 MAG: hypothetical protein COW20_19060 [bacterium (Candidatus Blackallbacteria) CG13_big_fil_rev_8_21_14_2_50_49_14]
MRKSPSRLWLAGLALLTACISHLPVSQNTSLVQINARSRAPEAIEKSVDPARMMGHLAILSGKSPFATAGLIPERGSAQGRDLTRAYLSKALENLGYQPELHNYRPNGTNVMARLMADTPSDEYIVLGAHLDSVRNAGADDNASGTVAVLEAATILRNLAGRKVNFIFAWFDEEEIGLVGSRYLARDLKKQGLKITSMHNIDMLAWDGDKDKTVEIAQPDGFLWDYYNMVNKTHGLNLPFDRTNTGQTDHESFHREGFNVICISEQYTNGDMTPYYHKRGDTYETVNADYLAGSTRLVVAVLADLSRKIPPPANIQVIPNDRFPSRPREFHASYDEHLE